MARDGGKNWIECTTFDCCDNQWMKFDSYGDQWRILQRDWKKNRKGHLVNQGNELHQSPKKHTLLLTY